MISLPLGRSKVADSLTGNTQERSDRPPPVSPAEYWAFLSIAMLFAVAFLAPVRPGSKGEPQNVLGTGAFGAKRSTDEPWVIQHKRAHEPGRGRHADAPWQIPLRGLIAATITARRGNGSGDIKYATTLIVRPRPALLRGSRNR